MLILTQGGRQGLTPADIKGEDLLQTARHINSQPSWVQPLPASCENQAINTSNGGRTQNNTEEALGASRRHHPAWLPPRDEVSGLHTETCDLNNRC